MHSKIIQLSMQPLAKDEWVEESNFYEGFVGHIADYVNEDLTDDQRNDVIEWFKMSIQNKCPDHVTLHKDSITFEEGFFEQYRKKFVATLKDFVEEIDENDFDDFQRHKLLTMIDDQFGWYVYLEGWGYETLDSFLSRNFDKRTFFFGAVIDYHF